MIRRVFWLSLGAAAGVSGYRKLARLARALSPAPAQETARSWPLLPSPGTARRAQVPWHGPLLRGARATAAFAHDVREGMRIYRLSDSREAPRLGGHRAARDWAATQAFADGECPDDVKDGR